MSHTAAHTTLHADRLRADVLTEQKRHPFFSHKLFADPPQVATALEAVSRGLGIVGNDVSWERRGPDGQIPMAVWLDTACTIEEHDSRLNG